MKGLQETANTEFKAEELNLPLFSPWFINLLKRSTTKTQGHHVLATAECPYQEELVNIANQLPKRIMTSWTNGKAINNVKQLGLAMLNYHGTYGVLPSDITTGKKHPMS